MIGKKEIFFIGILLICLFELINKSYATLNNVIEVSNEDEFKSAFYDTDVSEIVITDTFPLTSQYILNHDLRLTTISEDNWIQLAEYGVGVVVNDGCLTLDGINIDGGTLREDNFGGYCITVQNRWSFNVKKQYNY